VKSLVIVSGPAGAGKSTALHALEDQGYFCIDNLPVSLLSALAVEKRPFVDRVAAVMDGRDPNFRSCFTEAIKQLRRQNIQVEFLFLSAWQERLLARFSQLRRPHPLYPDLPLSLAVEKEQEQLMPMQARATRVINTTDLTPHQLKGQLKALFERDASHTGFRLAIFSFGFKYGPPPEADMVLEVRFLPNPYFVAELQWKTGLEKAVADFVLQNETSQSFFSHLMPLLTYLIPRYQDEGKASFCLAVGCTGGRHRSVAIALELQRRLAEQNSKATVWHRDLSRPKP